VDVFPKEPKTDGEEFLSPLRDLDHVLLTPHVGGSTEEAQESIGLEVAEKLLKYSNNGSTLSAVNFPEVALPEHPGKHRLLHIHRNQPACSRRSTASSRSAASTSPASTCRPTPDRLRGHRRGDGPPRGSPGLKRGLDAVPGTIRTRVLY
jgi:D-3-phosphoglycerate dehydrogenase